MNTSHFDKKQLRRSIRVKRRSLTDFQQKQAANLLAIRLKPLLLNHRHIAVYWPNDGEIDLRPFIRNAHACPCTFYLPVLNPLRPGYLQFCQWQPEDPVESNRFGIPEPKYKRYFSPRALDLALMPLVAFDREGGRLGMGGGFYDRTFAQHALGNITRIGVAHQLQETQHIPIESWDLNLHAVITDQELLTIS